MGMERTWRQREKEKKKKEWINKYINGKKKEKKTKRLVKRKMDNEKKFLVVEWESKWKKKKRK